MTEMHKAPASFEFGGDAKNLSNKKVRHSTIMSEKQHALPRKKLKYIFVRLYLCEKRGIRHTNFIKYPV